MSDRELVPIPVKEFTSSEVSFLEVLRCVDEEMLKLLAGVS